MTEKEQARLWTELKEINDRTITMNSALTIHIAESKNINEKIEDHQKKLYGNGKEGLIIVVDRLEKSKDRANKLNWLIIAALVPLVVASLWGFFTKPIDHKNVNATNIPTRTP